MTDNTKHQAFNVYLRGKLIDTVFYTSNTRESCEDVNKSLVEHDGYNPGIQVTRRSGPVHALARGDI